MKKDVFVDGHEQSDIIEDRKKFLYKMEKLKLYLMKFNKDGIMKKKIYLANCAIEGSDYQLVIVITYN